MPFWVEVLISFLIGFGAFFAFVGSLALVKLPGTMRRLHGPTKMATLGIGALLLASVLHFAAAHNSVTLHELLITVFLVLTAPVSAHMIAKVSLLLDRPSARQAADSASATEQHGGEAQALAESASRN